MKKLTLLSFGGGQDSWSILLKLIHDRDFREKYAPSDLLVAMSDTGWEHPKTYMFTGVAKKLCEDNNIPFTLITPDMGHHPAPWQHLTSNWEKNDSIGSVTFPQTCTDNIKIKPIDNYVAHYIKENYNLKKDRRHEIYLEFEEKYGAITTLIGFAEGEGKRVKNRDYEPKWKRKCIEFQYPLLDLGVDRAGAQKIISDYGHIVPPPSNCTICFYMGDPELIWLYRNIPEHFWHWVKLERNKKNKYRAKGVEEKKNHGPFGAKTIIQRLRRALGKYGHWTDAELEDYKMSHGHCTKSKF